VYFSGKSFRHGEKIRLAPGALIARQLTPLPGEKPVYTQRFRTRNPVSTRNGYRVEITCDSRSRSHARLTCSIAVVARTQLHARLTCGVTG